RYHNARDLANDLHICRDSLSSDRVSSGKRQLADAIPVSGQPSEDTDGSQSIPTIGLSPAFDSASATLRLAAMISSSDEVAELSKTLKLHAFQATVPNVAQPFVNTPPVLPPPRQNNQERNLLLIVLVSLILIGALAVFAL
ncbi:MAG: hypothetical protein Q7S51_08010, partial [Gallionellaceae bacterium]|nr:hypothetical protein [Gallionellaceae bacterium]